EAPELKSWLDGLARAVDEAAASAPPGDPVPPMLRDALGGLLFSHAELWSRETGSIGSVVLVGATERIGLGWVGEASVAVVPQDPAGTAEWVNIRDAMGREARAWCGPADREARIELLFTLRLGEPPARLEARWIPQGVAPAEAPTGAIETQEARQAIAETLS